MPAKSITKIPIRKFQAASTTKKAAKDQAEPTEDTPKEKPVKKNLAQQKEEALSLFDKKSSSTKKKPSATTASTAKSSKLPPISRIIAKTSPQPAPPAKATSSPPAAEPEAPAHTPETALTSTPSEEASTDAAEIPSNIIHLKPPITVKMLVEALHLKQFQVISDLMKMEIFASADTKLDSDIVAKVCEMHGFVFEKEPRRTKTGQHKKETIVEPPPVEAIPVPEEDMLPRAPIVTFMGHVDHGKTSLLDYIRKTRVAAGEAGGITQHIGAYTVNYNGKQITFLDTPGHEAFTSMRARGANVTDIAVIVVAADDGLMPQTLEALGHASAANVQIIIAINKMDLPGANPDRVKQQLQEKNYVVEDWGGTIGCCEVSAIKGTGINDLLERILLEAEMLELKASRKELPRGTVIEAQVESGMGPVATVIVRMGSMKVGQPFLCGDHHGKIKSLINDKGERIKEAGPSMPVKILGFDGLPSAGDEFTVMESERDARTLSETKRLAKRNEKLVRPQRASLESILASPHGAERKKLQIVLKADAQGSLEAIQHSLGQIKSEKVEMEILYAAVGPVSENDVLLASASNAVILGFSIKVEGSAVKAAKREGIQIKLYSIIYELIDQVKEAMTGLLDPETRETIIGHAEVKQVFSTSKGNVAGCVVNDGRVTRNARARVMRGRQPVYDGSVATLRRFQDEVKEVRSGLECGIKLGNFNEYQERDTIEFYLLEKIPQKL